jgi:F0F1-type ATP synthase membrane subunit c/vacuolar-type H+-ATPase subunit K
VFDLLARLRTRLGLVFGAAAFWFAQPTLGSIALGVAIAAAGEALRFWAAGHLHKSREVTASGPYRWVAHPLYVGSSVLGLGLAVASASLIVAILIGVYLGVTIAAAVRTEESFLRGRFGDAYQQYKDGHARAATRRFSFDRAIANGEHRTIAGIAAAGLLLALKATYNVLFWRTAGR